MLELEINRLKETDRSLKDQLKEAGLTSINDIVIRPPEGMWIWKILLLRQGEYFYCRYNPFAVMEIIYGTSYTFSPHQLAENVYGLINRQSVLSIIIMGITLAIASRK